MTLTHGRGRRTPAGVLAVASLAALAGAAPLAGQAPRVTAEDYARAERMLPLRADTLVLGVNPAAGYRNLVVPVAPHWIEGGPSFWYRVRVPGGVAFMLADPSRAERRPAFDHARLAAALGAARDTTYAAHRLPFESIEPVDDGRSVRFAVGDEGWSCDLRAFRCVRDPEAAPPPPGEARSPDGRWAVLARDHDLWLKDLASGQERRLTHDGEERDAWGALPGGSTAYVTSLRSGRPRAPTVLWSPDSERFLTFRLDERGVGEMHLVSSVNADGDPRPTHYAYAYPLPGDTVLPAARLVVFEAVSGRRVELDADPVEVVYTDPITLHHAGWSEDGTRVHWLDYARGRRAYRFLEGDAVSGAVRTLGEERGRTLVEANPYLLARPNIRVLADGAELLWVSERDGWAQLYRLRAGDGTVLGRVTDGGFLVQDVLHVDEDAGLVVFSARGAEPGRDPYYRHVYAASLRGGERRLLTPEDADHDVTLSPDGRWLVDTYSTVDRPPVTVVRSLDGERVMRLEEADITALRAAGWRAPERFRVKAADGTTDIYGTIYLPSNLDPSRAYPVLDDIYPGPQVNRAPVSFAAGTDAQALAELGFVVVTIDGRGTPFRSKAFHDYSYGNLESGGALEDHLAGLRQLAEQRPYMDLERVGVYGFSGGGFASTRAILMYPDFYDVAVSAAGNHDQRGYIALWGETYQGLLEGDNYEAQANQSLAQNLKGKLLLIHGDMDDNVHPSLTIKLVDALIEADKDFDMLIMPNRNHGFVHDPYYVRRRWDYFVEHLHGQEPPEYRITKIR